MIVVPGEGQGWLKGPGGAQIAKLWESRGLGLPGWSCYPEVKCSLVEGRCSKAWGGGVSQRKPKVRSQEEGECFKARVHLAVIPSMVFPNCGQRKASTFRERFRDAGLALFCPAPFKVSWPNPRRVWIAAQFALWAAQELLLPIRRCASPSPILACSSPTLRSSRGSLGKAAESPSLLSSSRTNLIHTQNIFHCWCCEPIRRLSSNRGPGSCRFAPQGSPLRLLPK